jgi:cystathionine beta-lyase family protein involved in aluminum resistance
MGNLKAGDMLVSLTGSPYDTLKEVIGIEGDEPGNLISAGIDYVEIELDSALNEDSWRQTIAASIALAVKKAGGGAAQSQACMFYIQKSCGYSTARPTLSNSKIARIIAAAKSVKPEAIVFVDNCYGEFVETTEPTAAGANLVAGSLIKNPGGGLAIAGGYIAGDTQLVHAAMNRLTAPGIGGHLGLTYNQNRLVLQGFFMAPSVVSNAVKGAMLIAQLLSGLGCKVFPAPDCQRFDIIQAVEFDKPERLVNFCRAIQRGSPVNAHVLPEPSLMPGYQDPVIMAAGTFIEGATIELSADGPLRPPYAAFVQGGLTYLHVKCVLEEALTLSASGDMPFF